MRDASSRVVTQWQQQITDRQSFKGYIMHTRLVHSSSSFSSCFFAIGISHGLSKGIRERAREKRAKSVLARGEIESSSLACKMPVIYGLLQLPHQQSRECCVCGVHRVINRLTSGWDRYLGREKKRGRDFLIIMHTTPPRLFVHIFARANKYTYSHTEPHPHNNGPSADFLLTPSAPRMRRIFGYLGSSWAMCNILRSKMPLCVCACVFLCTGTSSEPSPSCSPSPWLFTSLFRYNLARRCSASSASATEPFLCCGEGKKRGRA